MKFAALSALLELLNQLAAIWREYRARQHDAEQRRLGAAQAARQARANTQERIRRARDAEMRARAERLQRTGEFVEDPYRDDA